MPGEGRLWGVAVELAGVTGTFLGVPELLLSWPWEWQVLYPLPGSKAKVQLFQLLEGKGRGALACGAALSPSLLPVLGAQMSVALGGCYVMSFFFFKIRSVVPACLMVAGCSSAARVLSQVLPGCRSPGLQLLPGHCWGNMITTCLRGPGFAPQFLPPGE